MADFPRVPGDDEFIPLTQLIGETHEPETQIPTIPIHALLIARHSPYAFDPTRPVDADDSAFAVRSGALDHVVLQRAAVALHRRHPGRWHGHLGKGARLPGRGQPALGATTRRCWRWAWSKPPSITTANPTRAAEHDLGAASAFLTLEAVSRGLCVHQMIGIDAGQGDRDLRAGAGHQTADGAGHRLPGRARAHSRGLCRARPEAAHAAGAERVSAVGACNQRRLGYKSVVRRAYCTDTRPDLIISG